MPSPEHHLTLVAFADPNLFYQGRPEKLRDPDRFKLGNFIEHAKLAEAAGFDAIFKPDFLGFDAPKADIRPRAGFEPLSLLTALSQHTRRVGLIITESTSFTEPYNVARYLSSLDHISDGRAAWNVVTSYNGEGNFGDGRLLPLAERYRRADEFLDVTYRLWKGWREGAVSHTEKGHRFDGNLIDEMNFVGNYFRVKEPLDIPPGPQGKPVIVQAGASEEGLDFAAKHAELVFAASPDLETGISFYADLKRRVKAHGRDPASLKVLPGLNIFIAPTKADAEALYHARFTDQVLLDYREKIIREAPLFRIGELDLDEKIPASAVPTIEQLMQVERRRSRGLLLHRYLSQPGITLRDFLSGIYEFGHLTVLGTADAIADEIAVWFQKEGADGFVLKGGNSFAAVCSEVLPRLRRKGLLRSTEEKGLTFRQALFPR